MQYFSLILVTILISFNLSQAEDHRATEEKSLPRAFAPSAELKSEFLAKMGEESSSGSYRQLFIYSGEELKNVEFRVGQAENWNALQKVKSPSHQAYGSSSFLPSAQGQKFTVRGIRADGSRATYLLTVENADGSLVRAELIKEESGEEIKKEKGLGSNGADTNSGETSAVLMRAQANLGRCLGSGDCSALRGSGPALGRIGSGGAGLENLAPGQVLRLSPGAGLSGSMGYFRAGGTGHYIVVESVSPDGQMTFYDQNWAGGSSSGRKVRRATANLRTLSGYATIYSGN